MLLVAGLVIADRVEVAGPVRVAGPVKVTGLLGLAELVRVDGQVSLVAPGTADPAAAAAAVGMGSWFVGMLVKQRRRRWPERYRISNLFVVVDTSQSCHCSAG